MCLLTGSNYLAQVTMTTASSTTDKNDIYVKGWPEVFAEGLVAKRGLTVWMVEWVGVL